ncbi:MAG: hypothetical protein IAE62_00690 [Flavobacteriales bacterium]|nr:hypothetical protein [Flavobacteriales bacterium]MBN8622682.1 hypothetical protein [Flavobacteriales bacterium]UBB91062.1 hypothetical protein J4771_10575 [Candidatus Kaistella beijingensis]
MLNYIKNNWLLVAIAAFFMGFYIYLTYSGNQFCDCAKTETYRDGTTRSSTHGRTFYRYYHK